MGGREASAPMICDVLKMANSFDAQNATAPTPSGAAVTLPSLGEGQAMCQDEAKPSHCMTKGNIAAEEGKQWGSEEQLLYPA